LGVIDRYGDEGDSGEPNIIMLIGRIYEAEEICYSVKRSDELPHN
jgi:hypothetical protein